MRNILHFSNYQASYKGNFIESLKLLASNLKNENTETYFFFPNVSENSAAKVWMNEISNEYNVYNFNENLLEDAKSIRKVIQEKKIGIIHVHFFKMKHMLSIRLATFGLNVKIIMHFHNHSKPAEGIKSFFRKWLYSKTIMVSCSKSVYDAMERDYPGNEKYNVDNGVKYDRFEQYNIIDREEYQLKENSKILLMFGFDYYRKGVDLAIAAMNELNKKDNYELLISVSVNMERIRHEIINKYGEVPSYVKLISARSDVESLYNLCDIFISPSREEGLPYSVLEASYCKCSTVVSDIAPQKCLNKIPYIVYHKAENPKSLADAILKAVSQKEERTNNIKLVREFLNNNYSLENWANSIESIYNKVW